MKNSWTTLVLIWAASIVLLTFVAIMYPVFRAYESFLIVFVVTLPITIVTFKIIFNGLDIALSINNLRAERPTVKYIKSGHYIVTAITAACLVIGMTFLLNAKLDSSPYENHKVTVTEKFIEYRSRSHSLYAMTPVFTASPLSALKLDAIIPLHIDENEKFSIVYDDEYNNLNAGISQMNVRVKKGFFGIAYDDGHNLVIEKLGKKI